MEDRLFGVPAVINECLPSSEGRQCYKGQFNSMAALCLDVPKCLNLLSDLTMRVSILPSTEKDCVISEAHFFLRAKVRGYRVYNSLNSDFNSYSFSRDKEISYFLIDCEGSHMIYTKLPDGPHACKRALLMMWPRSNAQSVHFYHFLAPRDSYAHKRLFCILDFFSSVVVPKEERLSNRFAHFDVGSFQGAPAPIDGASSIFNASLMGVCGAKRGPGDLSQSLAKETCL